MSLKAMVWAWEQKVSSPIAKMILLKLADNTNDETGVCFPKHDTIAKHCECNRRTVIRNIKKLEKMGLVNVFSQYRDGKQIQNQYRLNLIESSNSGVTESHTCCDSDDTLGVTESHSEPVSLTSKSRSMSEKINFSDDDMKLSQYIFKKIQDINPKEPKPNFDKWANTIRLIRERDKRTHKEIQDVFLWANNDSFWQTNIRGPDKLRKKFTELEDKKRLGGTNGKDRKTYRPGSYRELESANARAMQDIEQLDREIEALERLEETGAGVQEALDVTPDALPASGVCLEDGGINR